jgi:hypothetical protein
VFVHEQAVIETALRLIELGGSSREIAAEVGVPDRTIRMWRAGHLPRGERSRSKPPALESLPSAWYAYLLGLYLGDGWIVASRNRSFVLRISLDERYPMIIDAAGEAMAAVHPESAVNRSRRTGCIVVANCWKHWPVLIPQHGRGPKHTRALALADWQARIVASRPREFVRGLIHSDGCRFVANQRKGERVYRYSRYSFSNRSDDIRAMFCEHLDLLGIGWTRPNDCQIAIDRRSEVAQLDAFVGPKR